MHKKKGWNRLSEAEKAEYRALHDEFVARSGEMLKEYEKSGSKKLAIDIECHMKAVNSARIELERKTKE